MITIGELLGVLFVVVWWIAVFVQNLIYILIGLIVCSVVVNAICLFCAFYFKNIDYLITSLCLSSAKVIAFCIIWFILI